MKHDDARETDVGLGLLEGEAAEIESDRPSVVEAPADVEPAAPAHDSATYYGLPAIKAPVWIATVPVYFYVGGLAGASLLVGAAAQLADRRALDPLVRRARWIGFAGTIASAALLVSDLGRPSRFLNMLRVFRPTSPMSVGSWVLAATGACASVSLVPGALGDAAGIAAGALGIPFAGYTAVLLGNTAVPVWLSARTTLPPLFLASALVSAASLLDLFPLDRREARLTHRLGVIGRVLELAAGLAVERSTHAKATRVGAPLRRGVSGALWGAAKVLTATSLVLAVLPGRSRAKRTASAIVGTLGAMAMRFAIFRAGAASADDPRATFELQRA